MIRKYWHIKFSEFLITRSFILCFFLILLMILFACFDAYHTETSLLCFHYPVLMFCLALVFLVFCYWLVFFKADALLGFIIKLFTKQ
jgi:hypothetical protein